MKVYLKIFLVILLLALAFWFVFSRWGIFRSDKQFAYPKTSKELTRIELIKDSITTILENVDDTWLVNGQFPASRRMIDDIKLVVSNLKVEYPLPKIYDETLTDSVMMAKGTQIKLYHEQSLKRSYFIMHVDTIGCLGLIEGYQQIYTLHMSGYTVDPCTYIKVKPTFWLNNIIFSFFPDEIKSVTVKNSIVPEQSFKIDRSFDGHFKLYDLHQAKEIALPDTLAIKRYFTYFNTVTFERYAKLSDSEKMNIFKSESPYTLIIVTAKDTYTYNIVYIPENEKTDAYGKPLNYNRQHFYLLSDKLHGAAIASWLSFDILLKNLSDFVHK